MLTNPDISDWSSLVAPPTGELFGRSISSWRSSARDTLGLPDKPVIVVGHQPEFFHPGVLAKFVAANQIAKEVSGVLVHLVVDHHIGNSGVIEVPDFTGTHLSTKKLRIANLDTRVSMKNQLRVIPIGKTVFATALNDAVGGNAAMQFASATDILMSPWANVNFCIAGTELLTTELGKAIIDQMQHNPAACISAYNNAIEQFPDCGITKLDKNELPLWQGKTNEKAGSDDVDLRPRALVLTLLARVLLGDLFVHGTGGYAYDNIMENWLQNWLHVSPCAKTMATATIKLSLSVQTIEQARSKYFSPPKHLLDAVNNAPYGSVERKLNYLAMHKWLEQAGIKPDLKAIKKSQQIANRRNWSFPLYDVDEITKDFSVPKLNQSSLLCNLSQQCC